MVLILKEPLRLALLLSPKKPYPEKVKMESVFNSDFRLLSAYIVQDVYFVCYISNSGSSDKSLQNNGPVLKEVRFMPFQRDPAATPFDFAVNCQTLLLFNQKHKLLLLNL